MTDRDIKPEKIDLDELLRVATADTVALDGLHGDPSKRGNWIGHRDRARDVVALIARVRQSDSGWRAGIEASISHIKAMQRKPRDLWHAAYFAACDEVLVHLEAMLERGTERSTTELT